MGDYVWAEIRISGHLEVVEDAEKLIQSISADGFLKRDDCLRELRQAVELNTPLELEDSNVNYGRFEATEEFIAGTTTLSSITEFGRGGDFDSGRRIIHNGKDEHFYGDPGQLRAADVERALLDEGPGAVLKLIAELRDLENCVTAITASPAVAAWLKIFGDKAA